MSSEQLLQSWRETLLALDVVDAGTTNATAIDNMEVFAIADALDCQVTVEELAAFLGDAHRIYSVGARRLGRTGWFYAWHDDQAGHVRTSAAWIASQDELPFRGRIVLVDDAKALALDALTSDYAHGIPLSGLVEVPREEWFVEVEPPPTKVYASRVLDLP